MSVRKRAAFAGAVLALAVAPAAHANSSSSVASSSKAAVKKAAAKQKKAGKGHKGDSAANASRKLRRAISAQGMTKHLQNFQRIADDNGGNRASGFQGYGGSVEYVVTQLRNAGYNPTTQVFDFVTFEELSEPVFREVSPTAKAYTQAEFETMSYSASGDTGVKTITPVDVNLTPPRASTSGCEAADFAGFPAGNIALIQRGTCDFAVKVVNAQNAGASGAIVFNQGNDPGRTDVVAGTLGETAQDGNPTPPDVTIPAIGISYAEGERLVNEADPTTGQIIVDAESDRRKSTNVLADTKGGNADTVTIVGSHLDSVPEGPGINDNGTGSAFNLELAIQMAKQKIKPANRVRFAWWGAEESGLVGATRYVAAISDEAFAQLAANLNFDMLGSPNHGKFVYDGDFSDSAPPATAPNVNPGAAYIEDQFVDYFESVGIDTDPTAFDGRSDYKPFQDNGIAAGGLFSGAEVAKSAEQAAKWGGTAGVAFDPCYHQACDDIDNVSRKAIKQFTPAVADAVARYAMDLGPLAGKGKAGTDRAAASSADGGEYLGDDLRR
jgi:Zn-dependent M28 family amino/carboxypeptidase